MAVDREIDPLHFFASSAINPANVVLAYTKRGATAAGLSGKQLKIATQIAEAANAVAQANDNFDTRSQLLVDQLSPQAEEDTSAVRREERAAAVAAKAKRDALKGHAVEKMFNGERHSGAVTGTYRWEERRRHGGGPLHGEVR